MAKLSELLYGMRYSGPLYQEMHTMAMELESELAEAQANVADWNEALASDAAKVLRFESRAVRAEAVVEAARDDPNQGVIAALAAYDAGQGGKPE